MTFYFYDLETSGISSRAQRIMQFAGQRTDMDLNPIGEPDDWLIKLSDEVLPDPEAVLITGITPQKTHAEGYTEAEFLKLFFEKVCQPDTIITGFNNVRFDDEFIRTTLWRNFYDPYEWQWQDGRSRWDLMDVVRMVRALRPDGIKWPFGPARRKGLSEHGKIVAPKSGDDDKGNLVPTNRLELLTELNGLSHYKAHDALSDVHATIAVAKLLKDKQPKMFDYLLSMRSKKEVSKLVDPTEPAPFLYTSGRYSNEHLKTTAVTAISAVEHGNVLVYDLSVSPNDLINLSDEELTSRLFSRDKESEELLVKVLKPNACPAVAPLGVLDKPAEDNIGLNKSKLIANFQSLMKNPDFIDRITQLYEKYIEVKQSKYKTATDPEFQLYDGFVGDGDKQKQRVVRASDIDSLADLSLDFTDSRLEPLLIRYKAKNYPRSLNADERSEWEDYRAKRIVEGADGQLSIIEFDKKITELQVSKTDADSQYLLEELRLYAESIVPLPED
jgi:exodeoxyribonuclease-1